MKITIYIILILILLYSIYYFYTIYKTINNLDYNVDLSNIDLSKFNLNDLNTTGIKIKATLKIDITNNSSKSISFRNLNINAFYENSLILNSSQDEINNFLKQTINSNSITTIYQVFDVYINKQSFDLIGSIKTNQNPIINYTVDVNWNGIKISQNLTYQI